MNQTLQEMKARRSVRSFRADAVPRELIEQITQAGIWAASGRNRQSAIVVAITDRAVRDRLARTNAEILGSEKDPFYGAPVILAVLVDRSCPTGIYDGSLVMGNLMLAASSLGLGSCWIHRAEETFDRPEWRDWLASVGVTGDYVGVGHCAIGYPEGDVPSAPARRENRVFWIV